MDQYFVRKSFARLLANIAAGAVAMYLTDPDRGKARRDLIFKKTRGAINKVGDVIDSVSNDARKRLTGVIARTNRTWTQQDVPIDNRILEARVRSKIGRAIRHPHAVKVQVNQGNVVLSGAVLADQEDWLINMARAVPGVKTVDNRLETHETADIPSLQGQGRYRKTRLYANQQNWSPSVRAAAALGGSALGYYGLTRRSPAGLLLAVAGAGLIVRSLSNLPSGNRPAVLYLQREIRISAPLETVFDAWSHYANLPRFMSHIKEVSDLGNGRSHWVLNDPTNNHEPQHQRFEWNAVLTRSQMPYVIEWESETSADIQHKGAIHFESGRNGTRVDVQIRIAPFSPALVSHMAAIFDGNPKRQLEEDMVRMKTYIESSTPLRTLPGDLQEGTQTLH